MVQSAVCLVSGGIDSCVTAFIAKNEGYNIYALSFNYGQRHKKEIECAKDVSSAVKTKDHIIGQFHVQETSLWFTVTHTLILFFDLIFHSISGYKTTTPSSVLGSW